MAKEYFIPPIEGFCKEPLRLRKFGKNESPLEIAIRKEDFDYLGDWNLMMGKDGYGIAYRLGIKENVTDDEGDLSTLSIHFALPVAKKGLVMTLQKQEEQFRKMEKFAEISSIAGKLYYKNDFISCVMSPPKWMYKELLEMLGSG